MSTETQSTFTSRIAGLAETDDDDTHVINGIAVGAGDLTHGLSRKSKLWQADELRAAASTLEGAEIKALHSDAVVGEVTKAAFEPTAGVLYEAELEDEKLAAGIANGRLTVSIEATHFDGGTVETAHGEAMAATNITFDGLAIVQKGAAPSATAEPGEAAALSPAAIQESLRTSALAGAADAKFSAGDLVRWSTSASPGTGRVNTVVTDPGSTVSANGADVTRRASEDDAVYKLDNWNGSEYEIGTTVKSGSELLGAWDDAPEAARAADHAAAAADSREQLTDAPTECRECGDRERTFNTMRCPECHPDMASEDHPPLATADEETIDDWQEAAASDPGESGAGDAGSDDPAGASSSSRDADTDTDADVDEAAGSDPESDGAGRDDPAGASSSSRDNDPASDDPETAAAAESNQTTDTTTTTSMSDDDDPEDVQELKARLSDKTEQIDTLEEQVDELEEENERLSERAEAVDEAEEAYAEALAEHVPRDAEDLQADLSLNQLREWLPNIDEADLADDVEPSVRSGNDPSGTETANLSEAERERKSELESKLSELEDKEGPLAEKEQERLEAELAEITGGDE